MTPTYSEVTQMQRVIHGTAHPDELARQISAEQFRPEEKEPDNVELRQHRSSR
jgi:hypothetical protein